MSNWRYIAQRLTGNPATDTFLDWALPLESVQVVDTLSGVNSLDATIPNVYTRLLGPDGQPILKPWETAIWAEKDGEIRGGGIVNELTPSGASLSIDCVGYCGYLSGMPYTDAGWVAPVGSDPLDIARYIWTNVQSKPNGNLGIILGDTLSGLDVGTQLTGGQYDVDPSSPTYTAAQYKLQWYQDNDLLSNFNDLAAKTPFDFHERHQWGPGETLSHYLDFGYPKLGRIRTDLRFVIGENIFVQPQLVLSGDDYATDAFVLGAGEGATMIHASAYRQRTGLRRVAVVSDSGIKSNVAALSRAVAEMNWRKSIEEIDSVVLRDHPNAPVGSVNVGDEIYVEGRLDWQQVGMMLRVTQVTIRPDSPDAAELTVTRVDKL